MASEPIMGAIFLFAGNFAPRGYLFCQGQLISIAQNSALFSILGTTYGGNGQTTFALPDLRGRAPIGQGNGPGLSSIVLGEVAGVESVTLLSSNVPSHTHSLNVATSPADAGPAGNFLAAPGDGGGGQAPAYFASAPLATLNPNSIGPSAGGGQPVDIRNPYLGLNYIIATEGIFPSRN